MACGEAAVGIHAQECIPQNVSRRGWICSELLAIARICLDSQVPLQRSSALCCRYRAKWCTASSELLRIARNCSDPQVPRQRSTTVCRRCRAIWCAAKQRWAFLQSSASCRTFVDAAGSARSCSELLGFARIRKFRCSAQPPFVVAIVPNGVQQARSCSELLGFARVRKFRCSAQPPFVVAIVPNCVQQRGEGH